MANTLVQWRSAIGSHYNFIKFKDSYNLWYLFVRMQSLLDQYGPVILPMFINFPYCYLFIAMCTWQVKVVMESSKINKERLRTTNATSTTSMESNQEAHQITNANTISATSNISNTAVSATFTFANIVFCLLILLLILMLCGDVPPNPGPMKFCHLNARSILSGVDLDTHIDDQYSLLDDIYECLVYINEFDVIAISETWLKDNVREDALDLAGYQLPLCKNRATRGGGVMLYVRDYIGAIHRPDLESNDTEVLWVELRLKDKKVLFATCYRPPGASALQVDAFIDSFSNQIENAMNENPDALIMVGDFNDRCTHWDDRHDRSEMGLKFYNYLNDVNLFQLVNEPTRITEDSASLLDLIVTDSPGYIDNINVLPPIGDLDHNIVCGHLQFVTDKPASIRRTVWHYDRANFDDLNTEFLNAPWNTAFMLYNNVNEILEFYYELLKIGMEAHIPKRHINKRKKDKPWMTGYIRHLLLLRNRLNGEYNKCLRLEVKAERNRMRNLCKREIKAAKARYRAGQTSKLADPNIGPKKFWGIMKELYGSKVKAAIPPLIDNNVTYSTNIEKANLFAKYFASQCSLDPPSEGYALPPLNYLTDSRLTTVDFDVILVRNIMSKLNTSKANGPDGVSNRVLKECADSLSIPLTDLFNKSMSEGVFPTLWKLSNISPVYKKAFRYLKENYRPVSLLPCMSKIMERIVYNAMYNFFKAHGLLGERNSGFKEKDSTINQLVHLCHQIYQGLDNAKDICLVFLDVSKAFDKVYHPALLHKLERMGIAGNLLSWIGSYLENRRQVVVINGVSSDEKGINASVPQGSILGPLLFLAYVNDIVDDLETTPYLFADDTSLFCPIDPKNMQTAFDKVNRDLVKMEDWAAQWRVTFNASKTVYMIISNRKNIVYPSLFLNGQRLTRVYDHKHLGMVFSHDMKWGAHIDSVLQKAFARLNGIRRLRMVVPRTIRETLYKALVLPIVEYGSVLIDNCSALLKQMLERLHRNAAVIVTGAFKTTSYVRLLDELGWDTLDDRRKLSRLCLLKKMQLSKQAAHNNKPDNILVRPYLFNLLPGTVGDRAGYVLRNAGKIDNVRTRLIVSYNSFLPKTIRDWNSLFIAYWQIEHANTSLQNTGSIDSFKARYRKEYLRSPNALNNLDYNNGNIHHTRLRLGLSHLRAHLFSHNLIDNPTCQFCNLEPETTDHYILRCPTYNNVRVRFLMDIANLLEPQYIASLDDSKIISIFLYGDVELGYDTNKQLFTMAQTFLVDSKRFNMRVLR